MSGPSILLSSAIAFLTYATVAGTLAHSAKKLAASITSLRRRQ
jgi:hypothetical protein